MKINGVLLYNGAQQSVNFHLEFVDPNVPYFHLVKTISNTHKSQEESW